MSLNKTIFDEIELHPSGIGMFFNCPYAWYRDNIYKPIRKVGSSAHIGTAIHKSAEVYYSDSIKNKKWSNPNNSSYEDIAVETFRNKLKDDEPTDLAELDIDIMIKNIVNKQYKYINKAKTLCDNILPMGVEKNYRVKVNSSLNIYISGTLDIVGENFIADIKTMKRKNPPRNYWLQQSIYSLLREKEEGHLPSDLLIHRVLTTKDEIDSVSICDGMPIFTTEDMKEKSSFLVRTLITTLEQFYKTGDEILFRGNHSCLTCNEKYCQYWHECKYKGIK